VNHHLDDLLPKGLEKEPARQVLEAFAKAMKEHQAADAPWTAPAVEAAIRAVCEANAAANADLWSPKVAFSLLRCAVTGRRDSPPLFDTIAAIGTVRCQERIAAALLKLR